MQAYDSAALEHAVTDDSIELSKRAARALTEKMSVLPDVGRVKDADDLFLVVSASGSEYLVDAREGVCECADYQYREPEGGCKHIHRCRYATGEIPIPEWADADAIDSHLGEHTEEEIRGADATRFRVPSPDDTTTDDSLHTDGGVRADKTAEGAVNQESTDRGPQYTYHYEPPHVGGARYVRCSVCGAECVPAKPDQMLHREGCSEGKK